MWTSLTFIVRKCKDAKMWGPCRTLQSIIFPWGPDLPKNLGTFFMRTDWVGEKKVMWGKQVWGVSSVNKDTPHVHTILWLVSSVSSLILLRKCLLNATSASKWAPFISLFIKLQSVFILLLIYLGLFWLNQIYLNEGFNKHVLPNICFVHMV